MQKFRELGLSELSLAALERKGFEEPTEIQARTIPLLLASQQDIIAQAHTGTGKTAAFGLVFMETLVEGAPLPQALVITPTRELAIQVAEEISSLKGDRRLRVAPVYGGQSIGLQLGFLKRGVDIVIGTPGRILDHLRKGSLNLSAVRYVVLDEADEMLNMGFIDDVEAILAESAAERRLLLFSATMPPRIRDLAKRFMKEHVLVQAKKGQLDKAMVDQIWFEVREADKFEALCRIIDIEEEFYGIVFSRTRLEVDRITAQLRDRGYGAQALHGDIQQSQREQILDSFRRRQTMVLVATDVAARGIDVNNLTHVINYSLPQDPEAYVHRIGRTGRAGKSGTAITFVSPAEYRRLSFIKRVAQAEIRKEKVPGAQEIVAIKKQRIKTALKAIIEAGDLSGYHEFVANLLLDIEPETALAALLKHAFGAELDEGTYPAIEELQADARLGGTTRLYITLGRKDRLTPRKLVEYLERETGVRQNLIQNVEIFEAFSFVTVSFTDAERILAKFRKKPRGSAPLVKKAAPPTAKGKPYRQGKGGR